MNLLDVLKQAEPNVSQISRDLGVSRQAVYLWRGDHLPSRELFGDMKKNAKYKGVLSDVDFDKDLGGERRVGRPKGSKKTGG